MFTTISNVYFSQGVSLFRSQILWTILLGLMISNLDKSNGVPKASLLPIKPLSIPATASYISFCDSKRFYGFTAKACPGGVRFFAKRINDFYEKCFCSNGFFQTGTKLEGLIRGTVGTDSKCRKSLIRGMIGDDKVCRPANESAPLPCDDDPMYNQQIFPLTGPSISEETVITMSYMRGIRRDTVKNLMQNRTRKENICIEGNKEMSYFVNPSGSESKALLYYCDPLRPRVIKLPAAPKGKIYYGVPNEYFENRTREVTETCDSVVGIKNWKSISQHFSHPDLWGKTDYQDLGPGISECTLESYCKAYSDSWVLEPPSDLSTSSSKPTPQDLHNILTLESQSLVNYRFRIKGQGALLRQNEVYSRSLAIISITKNIFTKIARFLIPGDVLDATWRMFEFLYFDRDTKGTVLTDREFEGVKYGLRKCLQFIKPLNSSLFVCPAANNATFSAGESKNSRGFDLRSDRLYNPEGHDMFVELAWKWIDAVHMACSPYFSFNRVLHHDFSVDMLRFFAIGVVQDRWFRKVTENDRKVFAVIVPNLKERVLHTADSIIEELSKSVNVYDNNLRRPEREIRRTIDGCPPDRQIWGERACCLDYSEEEGILHLPNESPFVCDTCEIPCPTRPGVFKAPVVLSVDKDICPPSFDLDGQILTKKKCYEKLIGKEYSYHCSGYFGCSKGGSSSMECQEPATCEPYKLYK